jgi:hypothetical protein
MNGNTFKPIEPNQQSGGAGAHAPRSSDEEIVTADISDEALEAASGVGESPRLLPCTSPPCLASTFCENKC